MELEAKIARSLPVNSSYDRGEKIVTVKYRSGPSNKFVSRNNPTIMGVKRCKINSVSIPKTYFEINNTTYPDAGLFSVTIGGVLVQVTLDPGTYTPEQLAAALTGKVVSVAAGVNFRVTFEYGEMPIGAAGRRHLYPGKFVFTNLAAFPTVFTINWIAPEDVLLAKIMGAPFTVVDGATIYANQTSTAFTSGSTGIVSTNPANTVVIPYFFLYSNTLSSKFSTQGNYEQYMFPPIALGANGYSRVGQTAKWQNIIKVIPTRRHTPTSGIWYTDPMDAALLPTVQYFGWSGGGYIQESYPTDDGYMSSNIYQDIDEIDFSLLASSIQRPMEPLDVNLNSPEGFEVEVVYYCQQKWTG